MGWIAPLRGRVVGLDTTPLIYFIEENSTYLELVGPFFEAIDQGEVSAVTSKGNDDNNSPQAYSGH